MQKRLKIVIILLFFSIIGINAAEIKITEKAVESYLSMGNNRSFNFIWDISASGLVEINNIFTFKGGVLTGTLDSVAAIKTFTQVIVAPFQAKFLEFSLAYIYNGLPEYEAHSQTLLPLFSLTGKIAGISLGAMFRFTSFLGEDAIFEPIFSFSAFFNFVNNSLLRIGIGLSNFDNFNARNFAAFTFTIISALRLGRHWYLVNDLELMQSGLDGLSAAFYGFAWKGGAKFSW